MPGSFVVSAPLPIHRTFQLERGNSVMITMYQVTRNGSPMTGHAPATLLAAAYSAACLATKAPSDRRGDRTVCVYDVEPVDVRPALTDDERRTDELARGLAYIASGRVSTMAVSLISAHEAEADELAGLAETVEYMEPALLPMRWWAGVA